MRLSQDPQELIDEYTGLAQACRQEAARTTLPNQLERLRQAEDSWLGLAAAQRNVQAARARRLRKEAGEDAAD
jgi:hypothetical protein